MEISFSRSSWNFPIKEPRSHSENRGLVPLKHFGPPTDCGLIKPLPEGKSVLSWQSYFLLALYQRPRPKVKVGF